MNTLQLGAVLLPDGSLDIRPDGTVPVMVLFSTDENGARIATIAFGGFNQAVVTFDATGTYPITYMMYDPMPTLALDSSIQNIVNHVSGIPTLH